MSDRLFDSHSSSSGSAANQEGVEYGNLVTVFVETCQRENGQRPPRNVIERMGKEIGKLVRERIPRATLVKGIEILVDRGLDPSMLPSAVFTAQSTPDVLTGMARRRSQEDAALLRSLTDRNGGRWPTGVGYRRGSHSAQEVFDPLGYGYPPKGWPHERPSKDQVIAALRAVERSSDGDIRSG